MKVTKILGFSEAEIETLKAAGGILNELAAAYNEETENEIKLDETAVKLIGAFSGVIDSLK